MEKISYNNIPEGIDFIIQKLSNLEELVNKMNHPPKNEKLDRIDKTADVCILLGISSSKIYKMTMNDEIPHSHTTTGRLIYSRKELLKWQNENIAENKPNNEVLLNITKSALRKRK
jgi:predicted DNA-binding transcriptional regulator AlpA